jgi:hypothetical protein
MMREIDQMDPRILLASDPKAHAEHLAGKYGVRVPHLLPDQISIDSLEEIDIRPPGGFTAETAEMYAAGQRTMKGTRVTVQVPFEGGHLFVFNMTPTTKSTASPPCVHRIEDDELILVYETTEFDSQVVRSHLDRTVEDIQRYLGWVTEDVSRDNDALLRTAHEHVAARQSRLRKRQAFEEELGIPASRERKLDLREDDESVGEPQTVQPSWRLRVFLCHSSGDKFAVRDLYGRLRNDGVEPWLDEENLVAGQEWQREIPKAVRESDVVLVCLSQASMVKAGYVQKEIRHALDVAQEQPEGSIYIIPVKLEELEGDSVPERLRNYQWVNLFEEHGFTRLMRALRRRAEQIGLKWGG